MACDLQKLFSVEADFEDEDFLLAVKDVEKKALNPALDNLRCLRPISAGLRTSSSSFGAANESVSHGLSEPLSPVLQAQSCSKLKYGENTHFNKLKSHEMSPQVTGFGVQKDFTDKGKSSCTSGARFKFVKRRPAMVLATGTLCDETDNELMLAACMDVEKCDTQLQPESCTQIKDNSGVTAKKPRLTDSVPLTDHVGSQTARLNGAQKENLEKGVNNLQPVEGSPKLFLRPTAVGSQSNLGGSSSMAPLADSSCQMFKFFQASLDKPTAEPQSPRMHVINRCSSSFSTNTLSRPLKSQMPDQNNAMSKMISGGTKLLSAYGSSTPSVESAPGVPKAPCLSGNLQSPVVTNHLVRLVTAANKTPLSMAHVPLQAKTRRFPGPAGLLPHQPDGKSLEEILIATPQIPTHGALAKLQTEEITTSQQPIEDEFGRGPWVAMKTELGLDERNPSCFLRTYSVIMVLRKAALKQLPKNKVPSMAVMIKSLMRASVDAAAVFKDPTGEIQGTIHRLLLEEKESEFKTGSVLLLKQVGVFSPSHRNHYLNVTPSNLVKIYPPGYSDSTPIQIHPESAESMETVQLQVGSQFQQDSPGSPLITVPTTVHRSQLGQEMDENCYQHGLLSLVSGNCKESELIMSAPSPKSERSNADDLDQLLGELPDEFFSSFDAQSNL